MDKKKEDSFFKFVASTNIVNIIKKDVTWIAKLKSDEEYNGKKFRRTKKYLFYKELFNRINALEQKLNDLEVSRKLILSYKNFKKNNDITKTEYILYHMEYFYINIIGLYDRMLHLVNFTYELGLSDRYVQKDIIVNNNKVDNKVKKFLKEFDKKIQAIRTDQNRIKHKDKYYDKQMYEYEIFEMAAKTEENIKLKRQFLALSMTRFVKYKKDLDGYLNRQNRYFITVSNSFLELLEVNIIKRHNKHIKK